MRVSEARDDLELTLGEGGAIEGRVLVAPGVDPAGTVVGFHRGDGEPRTVRVGADGRYRLDGLAVGPWEVTRRGEELDPARSSTTFASGPPQRPAFNCEVREGETTTFDLDLRDAPPCVVKGRLTVPGVDLSGWTASLVTASIALQDDLVASGLLAADGSFELTKDLPGRYRLLLQAPPAGSGRLEVDEVLELAPGENPWSLALAFGSVDGSGAPTGAGAEEVLEYTWQAAPAGRELKVSQRIVVGDGGRFALPFVPAGEGKVAKYRAPDPGEHWGEWIELARFDVGAGEALALPLP